MKLEPVSVFGPAAKRLGLCLALLAALFPTGCKSTAGAHTAKSAHRTVFNVRNFGATGDGRILDSPAIDKAIRAASAAGGGTVLVPAGTYLSGSIHLTNNINLQLDAGAVILGAPQAMNAYDPTEPWNVQAYQDGGHVYFHNSLIWGENLTNVSITGPGLINGGGLVRDDKLLDDMCGFSRWSPTNRTPRLETNFPPVPPRQQGHCAQTLPQRPDPRHHHFPRRPFCDPGHRL